MVRTSFGGRLIGGFALAVGLTVLMGATSAAALATVTESKDEVIASASRELVDSQQLSTIAEQRIGNYRAYLLTGSSETLTAFTADRDQFLDEAARLRTLMSDPVKAQLLEKVAEAEKTYTAALEPTVGQRRTVTNLQDISQLNTAQVGPARRNLQQAITDLITQVREDAKKSSTASTRTAALAIVAVCVLGVLSITSAAVIAVRLNRALRREVGAAVSHIKSSSAQLEAAASLQADGGKHQASAMNDINSTINELLLTSRQIADNAQRVSEIAEDTTQAALAGDTTIDQTRQSIAAIRDQVDQIVQHMLVLGERSQQVGGIADLVSELAEQTNILAINATIEASDAGDWGRRFAVVAEEIRKLADRTAGSAKQIRTLSNDVRGAVNTTVMATEIGVKAVDAGVQRFDDATASFRRIAILVSTANDATREIQVSTKQQATAIEQVNAASSDTARVTRETEVSAIQTRQTAAHLSSLSSDLQELVGAGER